MVSIALLVLVAEESAAEPKIVRHPDGNYFALSALRVRPAQP